MTVSARAELGRNRFRATGKNCRIHRYGGECRPELNATPGEYSVECENANRLATRANPCNRVFDRSHDVRVSGLTDSAEARREVPGAGEDSIDSLHSGYLLQLTQGIRCLNLHEQAQFVLRVFRVVFDPTESR